MLVKMIGLLCFAVVICGIPTSFGCRRQPVSESTGFSTRETESQLNEQLLQYAVKNLQRLDDFQGGEMRQQVIDRLNQWIRIKKVPDGWRSDPMIASLPERLRDLASPEDLRKLEFSRHDGLVLQEDVWARDISTWARGKRLEDLPRAVRLFDWTVRNIQIEEKSFDGDVDLPQSPWETLLLGRGTAVDRAWIFTLLARQQGIDAVLLALPEVDEKSGPSANTVDSSKPQNSGLRIWAVGVLDEGRIYLFDAELGLPIPAADGVKFNGNLLDIHPATLADAARDDNIFRQLDMDPQHPYPLSSAQLSDVVGLVVASAASLSARMAIFQSKLSGDERVVLTDNPSAVAARFKKAGGLSEIRLWRHPFEVPLQRDAMDSAQQTGLDAVMAPFKAGVETPLWRGRTLLLKGDFTGKPGATYYLQKARPSNRKLMSLDNKLLQQGSGTARAEAIIAAYRRAKQDATYWLGLTASLNDDVRAAVDYLVQRTLDEDPQGPWTAGAKYNLARTYEAAGKLNRAAAWLKDATLSPGRHGNLLRAKWLEDHLDAEKAKAEQKQKAEQIQLPGL